MSDTRVYYVRRDAMSSIRDFVVIVAAIILSVVAIIVVFRAGSIQDTVKSVLHLLKAIAPCVKQGLCPSAG